MTKAPQGEQSVRIRPFAAGDARDVRELFIAVNRLLAPPGSARSVRGVYRPVPCCGDGSHHRLLRGTRWRVLGRHPRGPRGWDPWPGTRLTGSDGASPHVCYARPTATGHPRLMLAAAEAECRRRGFRRLELSTSELQPAALALYRNSGYALAREIVAEQISNKTVGGGIRRYYLEKMFA
jgi:GNAT superfamily N-acetyltransferase